MRLYCLSTSIKSHLWHCPVSFSPVDNCSYILVMVYVIDNGNMIQCHMNVNDGVHLWALAHMSNVYFHDVKYL